MKNRKLNSKYIRLVSAGLLVSSAAISTNLAAPIIAKEAEKTVDSSAQETEEVAIIQQATSESAEALKGTESSNTSISEETPVVESTQETTPPNSEVATSTESSESSKESESSTAPTTSSSTSSSTNNQTTSSTTTSSTTTTNKPNKQPTKPTTQQSTATQNTGTVTEKSEVIEHTPNSSTDNGAAGLSSTGNENETIFHVQENATTADFIKKIAEDAREIGDKNDLYASVMIAQAILESGSGNSSLAAAPNYNLFGIKGSYQGASTNFLTSEDDGNGKMYTIRSDFRKYPSYKESLTDYAKLLQGGVDGNSNFYNGTWKSKAKTYQEATKYLTGRYATDTSYNKKLNALIETYKLTEFDQKVAEKIKTTTKAKTETKTNEVTETTAKPSENKIVVYEVKKGDSLKSIAELHNVSVTAILEKNRLERQMLFIGQKINVPQNTEEKVGAAQEKVVKRSIALTESFSKAFTTKKSSTKKVQVKATRTKSQKTYEVKKGDTLASIANSTGISVNSLKRNNDLMYSFLTEGQQLTLSSEVIPS